MRKSRSVDLTLLLAVAPLVAGCGGPRCVDPDGARLEDQQCDPASPVYRPAARWVQGGRSGSGGAHGGWFGRGGSAGVGRGGSAGVARGGFGSTGAGHAGGHGGT